MKRDKKIVFFDHVSSRTLTEKENHHYMKRRAVVLRFFTLFLADRIKNVSLGITSRDSFDTARRDDGGGHNRKLIQN